ncbi:hypothetical protein AB6N24_18470 [Cellulomonas sp. 179-A 4D5 NHS]|uniref:WD40 repeat domain-containing protein n=1 Tax=Cellulomonas sp. 179-A 4D5 NHS TaxID=3142378 RepID=UPI0039A324B0
MSDLRLITVGLSSYSRVSAWSVDEAESCRLRVVESFAQHGFDVDDWTARADNARIRELWEEFRLQDDVSHVIYWIGHGTYGEKYVAALADSPERLSPLNGMDSAMLLDALQGRVRRLAAARSDRWVLVILDTCGSRRGAWDVFSGFTDAPANFGIVGTGDGAAFAGRFTEDLESALSSFGPNETAGVRLGVLVERLNARLGPPPRIYAQFSPTASFPSRFDGPTFTATLDVYDELRQVLADAPEALRNHFYARAQGTEIGAPAWHFTGRANERRAIVAWLRGASSGMYAVTGDPGAGKSAVIGMVLASTDEGVLAALAAAGHPFLPDDLRPTDVLVDAAIHLSGLTIAEATATIAALLGGATGVNSPDVLVNIVAQHQGTLTVVADALDECRDPFAVASLLARIAALPQVRVLVGTRQSLNEDPDDPAPADQDLVDALGPMTRMHLGREPRAVEQYVTDRLGTSSSGLPHERVEIVARQIATHQEPFLFARLAVHEILAEPLIAHDDGALKALLGKGHRGLFAHAFKRLLANDRRTAALVRVLTYARGGGFPRSGNVWATVAAALSGEAVNDVHVAATLRAAAPYVMESSEGGEAVYRLAHRTFVEFFRAASDAGGDSPPDQRGSTSRASEPEEAHIVAALCSLEADDRPSLPPYVCSHLAEHVSAAAGWDRLATEYPEVLAALDPVTVRAEGLRMLLGRASPPPPLVAAIMMDADALAPLDEPGRNFLRTVTARRLGVSGAGLHDPRVAHADLQASSLHVAIDVGGLIRGVTSGRLPDGRAVVAAVTTNFRDTTIRFWDPLTGAPWGPVIPTSEPAFEDRLWWVTLPDGRPAVAMCSFDTQVLWDATTGQVVDADFGRFTRLRATVDGRLALLSLDLAANDADAYFVRPSQVRLRGLPGGGVLASLDTGEVRHADLTSVRGKDMVVIAGDVGVDLVDISEGRRRQLVPNVRASAIEAGVARGQARIAVGTSDGAIIVVDPSGADPARTLAETGSFVHQLRWGPAGALVAETNDSTWFLDSFGGSGPRTVPRVSEIASPIAPGHPVGRILAVTASRSSLQLWDHGSGMDPGHERSARAESAAFLRAEDGPRLVQSMPGAGLVVVTDAGRRQIGPSGSPYRPIVARRLRSGRQVVGAANSVWDADTGELICELTTEAAMYPRYITDVAEVPDKTLLIASGGPSTELWSFRPSAGKPLISHPGSSAAAILELSDNSVTFLQKAACDHVHRSESCRVEARLVSDGHRLARRPQRLWTCTTRDHVYDIVSRTWPGTDVAALLTNSELVLVDGASGEVAGSIPEPHVQRVAFGTVPNGMQLVAASTQGHVVVWVVDRAFPPRRVAAYPFARSSVLAMLIEGHHLHLALEDGRLTIDLATDLATANLSGS